MRKIKSITRSDLARHEHAERRDFPLPKVGATGTEQWGPSEWLDESHHDFVILDHYTQKYDIGSHFEWGIQIVTKCQYTNGPSEGDTFYLWRDRWNRVTIHTAHE